MGCKLKKILNWCNVRRGRLNYKKDINITPQQGGEGYIVPPQCRFTPVTQKLLALYTRFADAQSFINNLFQFISKMAAPDTLVYIGIVQPPPLLGPLLEWDKKALGVERGQIRPIGGGLFISF